MLSDVSHLKQLCNYVITDNFPYLFFIFWPDLVMNVVDITLSIIFITTKYSKPTQLIGHCQCLFVEWDSSIEMNYSAAAVYLQSQVCQVTQRISQ